MANSKIIGTVVALALAGGPVSANDDFVKGLIGGIVGAAIVNGAKAQPSKTQRSTGSVVLSAQRIENRGIQEALNYFGFNAGSPDGILGRKTTQAVSQMQACLGYQITGKLNSFEQQFLSQSYFKAQAGGNETLRLVATMPNGYCGVLQTYLADLTKPAASVSAAVTASATPAPTTAVTNTRTNVVVNQAAPPQNVTVNNTEVTQTNIATVYLNSTELQQEFDRLVTQLKLLEQISEHVRAKASDDESRKKLSAITKRITELEKLVKSYERDSKSKYGVPIKPSNANLGVTAAKASEVFPRVPYYIPGTEEIGEMWIKPYVSNGGELLYDFNFVDKTAEFGKIKDTIVLSANNIGTVSTALVKVNKWSDQALEKNLRRRFEKSAACFPQEMCGRSEVGNTSTDIIFMLYEDGSTAAKIQQNKGRFKSGYNVSVESGLLLAAYSDYMIEIGSKEFEAATMTDAELDAVFD